MKNIRLGDQGAGQGAVPTAAPALKQDRVLTGIMLEYLARRIEGANGDSPNLISAASRLVPDAEGSERECRDRRRPDTQAQGAGCPRHLPWTQRRERSFGERSYSQRQRSAGGTRRRAGKEKLIMVKYVIGATGARPRTRRDSPGDAQ
jgi:hypothetical protein